MDRIFESPSQARRRGRSSRVCTFISGSLSCHIRAAAEDRMFSKCLCMEERKGLPEENNVVKGTAIRHDCPCQWTLINFLFFLFFLLLLHRHIRWREYVENYSNISLHQMEGKYLFSLLYYCINFWTKSYIDLLLIIILCHVYLFLFLKLFPFLK